MAADRSAYTDLDPINVSGSVIASAGTVPSGTSVFLQIKDSQNTLIDAGTAPVDPLPGTNRASFSKRFVAGGPRWRESGTYTLIATWAPDLFSPVSKASTTFTFTPKSAPTPVPPGRIGAGAPVITPAPPAQQYLQRIRPVPPPPPTTGIRPAPTPAQRAAQEYLAIRRFAQRE